MGDGWNAVTAAEYIVRNKDNGRYYSVTMYVFARDLLAGLRGEADPFYLEYDGDNGKEDLGEYATLEEARKAYLAAVESKGLRAMFDAAKAK